MPVSSKLFIRQLTSPFRYTRRRTLTAAASRNGRPSSSFAGRNRAGPRPAPRRMASADDEVVRGCAPAAVRPGHRRHTATADDENGSSSSSDRPAGRPALPGLAWHTHLCFIIMRPLLPSVIAHRLHPHPSVLYPIHTATPDTTRLSRLTVDRRRHDAGQADTYA